MTTICDFIKEDLPIDHPRRLMRELTQQEFIDKYGSGTLKKSQKLGFNIQEAYLKERTRFEFGQGFECIQRSRVTFSDIKLVSCQSLTELGWHTERMIELRPFESDIFMCKQFEVEFVDNKLKEGAGILVWKTSAYWIPKGHMIFSIVSEKKNGEYLPAINPF